MFRLSGPADVNPSFCTSTGLPDQAVFAIQTHVPVFYWVTSVVKRPAGRYKLPRLTHLGTSPRGILSLLFEGIPSNLLSVLMLRPHYFT